VSDIYDDNPPEPSGFDDARGQDIDPGAGDSARWWSFVGCLAVQVAGIVLGVKLGNLIGQHLA
jgi:hypothetical protein